MQETTLEHLHKDLKDLKRDMALVKHILSEEHELSEEAKKKLAKARKTSDSEYVSHEEVRKRFLK